jgi:hypothetical protein
MRTRRDGAIGIAVVIRGLAGLATGILLGGNRFLSQAFSRCCSLRPTLESLLR